MNAVVDTSAAARERLRALRRQAGRIDTSRSSMRVVAPIQDHGGSMLPPTASAEAVPTTADTKTDTTADATRVPPAAHTIEDLRRLLRVRAPAPAAAPRSLDRALPGEEIAPGLRFVESLVPERALPATLCGAFDRREHLSSRDLLFFDTETTGLAGGTGTRAFMIGTARWCDAGLRVRQWWITALAAERALLAAFAEETAHDATNEAVLVSFNGKSYDAPLLAARYRLARMPNPLAGLAHVDLLYPSRRRYRGRWENCRLATLERRVLGVAREDDLPGSEAPGAWLRYLRGGDARDLRRVVDHNRQDVVSMSGLLLHLSAAGEAEAQASRRDMHCADDETAVMLSTGGYEGPSFSHRN